jgi:uncharacterized membrane protein
MTLSIFMFILCTAYTALCICWAAKCGDEILSRSDFKTPSTGAPSASGQHREKRAHCGGFCLAGYHKSALSNHIRLSIFNLGGGAAGRLGFTLIDAGPVGATSRQAGHTAA